MKTTRLIRFALTLCFVCALAAVSQAQQLSPSLQAVGRWQVNNDEGKPGGQVETYIVDGKLFGKVTQLRPGRQPGDVCTKCSGDLKDKPILGMVFLKDFRPEGDAWVGGTVVDPDNGREYKGKIWNEGPNSLKLRGFIGFSLLGRTQVWTRLR